MEISRVAALLMLGVVFSGLQASPPQAPKQDLTATSSEVEVEGCLDRKDGKFVLTNAFFYVLYDLTGQTAGLENHIGDDVKLRGIEVQSPASSTEPQPPKTLQVTGIEVLVHAKPAGVPPVLGSPETWVRYENPLYGVRLRYPATFGDASSEYSRPQSNFVGQEPSTENSVVNVSIPRTTYPDSNFVSGAFTVFASPSIRSEGTCKQFRSFWPEQTTSTNIDGINYSRTMQDGVAMGTAGSVYYFHTFQNGVCYEFALEFAEATGGGMDIPCSIQWVKEDNTTELMQSILSTVSFPAPLKHATSEAPSHKLIPTVTSFEYGNILEQPVGRGKLITVAISWKTTDADYVQIRYPCREFLYASTAPPSTNGVGLGKCGEKTDINLPPNGSMSLLLSNFSAKPAGLGAHDRAIPGRVGTFEGVKDDLDLGPGQSSRAAASG